MPFENSWALIILSATVGYSGAGIRSLDPSPAAFVNVNVIPVSQDGVLPDQTVLVQDGRITQFGPASQTRVPDGCRRIDGKGKFLIPGLADMHVHLLDETDFILLLANGVTTVVNMAGGPIHLEMRDRLRNGQTIGPMLYTTGPQLEQEDDPFLNTRMRVDTTEKARFLVEDSKKSGYDFVKVHGDPLREVYDAFVAAAKEHDIRVVGHGSEKFKMEVCLDAKQATIEHTEEFLYCYFRRQLDESRFPDIVVKTKASGTYVTPTLVTYLYIVRTLENIEGLMNRPELRYYDAWKQAHWGPTENSYIRKIGREAAPQLRANYEFLKKLTLALHRGGVPLMVGTDYGGPGFLLPGFDVPVEMEVLVELGLTPQEALRAATLNPGSFLSDGSGAVRHQARADLVLLEANPLADIGHVRKIAGVMVRGKWLTKAELDSSVEALVVENAEEKRVLDLIARRGWSAGAEEIEKAVNSGKKCPVSLIALGWYGRSLVLAQKPAEMIPVSELLVKLYPATYLSHDLLGRTYLMNGQVERGKSELRESLRLYPNNTSSRRLLEQE